MNLSVNRSILVCLVLFILAIPAHTNATLLTFEGTIEIENLSTGTTYNQLMSFSVEGSNVAWNNTLITGFVNVETPIDQISTWSLFDEREIPSSYQINNSYSQVVFGGSRVYHELLDGYDSNTLQYWSHEIDIRGGLQGGIDSFIGVSDHFTYDEHFAYWENFTFDGSTSPNKIDHFVATGFLTLTAVDYTSSPVSDTSTPASAPEPPAILLLGIGLLVSIQHPKFKIC